MKFKDLYLPIGLIFAFIFGFMFPKEGEYLFRWNFHSIKLSQMLIFLIFGISGFLLKLDDFKFNRHLIISLFGGLSINLFLAPCIAMGILIILPLPSELRIGYLTIACVPPTMASGIISTVIAKGNVAWAIVFTIIINIVGIFVIPFTFGHSIQLNAGNGINSLQILQNLLMLVLLPAIIGFLIKKKYGDSKHFIFTYFQPTAIIFIAFCTVGAGKEDFTKLNFSSLSLLLFMVILLHMLLFTFCIIFSKTKKLSGDETIALTFVCSQKTLPLALALLITLPKEIASIASISCLLYHLSQVFIDSFIAYFWQKKQSATSTVN